jgi:hypothetical protein
VTSKLAAIAIAALSGALRMASKQTLDCMSELYQGEIFGEAVNERLLSIYKEPQAQRLILASLQAETETKARLRPAMVRLGVQVTPPSDLKKQVDEALEGFKGLSWSEGIPAARAAVSQYVERYKEIARIAQADGDPVAIDVANYMVIHETAFVEMFDRLVEGDPNPTKGVDALMHFPMPGAA